MLEIFFDYMTDRLPNVIRNVDDIFITMPVLKTETNINILRELEQASYYDTTSYIDRFGIKLSYSDISTGCKVALAVSQNPDLIFDTIECGWNARDIILYYCTDGKIIFRHSDLFIGDDEKDDYRKINVKLNEYNFTTVESLNEYIQHGKIVEGAICLK